MSTERYIKTIEIKDFLKLNDIELSWEQRELIAWIPFHALQEFITLVGKTYFIDDGGYRVDLQADGVALDLVPILEYLDIIPEEIYTE